MEWSSGQIVADRFQIVDRLGEGGMGVVYRATDTTTGRDVALKALAVDSEVARFKREFRAARRLSHPNCVRVGELASHGDRWFFSMEYVPGGSLEAIPRPGPAATARLGCQVLAALDHVHARQIVHRDVKPQNILVDRTHAHAKLSDLGIAQVDDADAAFTVGQMMGSARYACPEQARGEAVDPRGDLYSLGVVLYELLTGEMPVTPTWRGRSGWLDAHRNQAARRPEAPELPAALVDVVMKLLAKDPRDRYPTAAAAFDALAGWLRTSGDDAGFLAQLPPLERKGYVAAPDFIGRARDLAAIDGFARAVVDGAADAPLLCRVFGDAGMGKSRLVSRTLPHFEAHGAQVILGACRSQGGAPYEPVRRLLDLREDAVGDDGIHTQTTRSEAVTVAERFHPGDAPQQSTTDEPDRPDIEDFDERDGQLWRLHRGVANGLIERAVISPIVVVVEDIQWADAATLALLAFVVRALADARGAGLTIRAGIIVTHRREVAANVAELGDTAAELGVAQAIELVALDAADAGELVSAMLSTPRDAQVDRFTARLLGQGEGTPLFVGQALHLLVGAGHLVRGPASWNLDEVATRAIALPATVREAIGDRATRLKLGTQRALGVAAVRGRRFALADIAPIVSTSEQDLLDDLDEAVRAGFLEEEAAEGRYAFAHDRFREAIYERLPRDESRALHRAIAALLRQRFGRAPEVAAELAHHAWEGGDARHAYVEWWRAGDFAMERYAFGRAVEMYTRALDAARTIGRAPRAGLLDKHGDACLMAGQYQAARDSYAQRLDRTHDDLERAELLRRQAEVEHRSGNTAAASRLLEDVLRALGFRVPGSRAAVLLRSVWNTLVVFAYLVFPLLRKQAARAAPDRRTQIIARTCGRLTETYYWSDFPRAAFYQLAGLRIAERLGPSPELTISLTQQGFVCCAYGFYRLGFRYLERARACGEAAATPVEQGWQELLRGMSHACAGRVDEHIAAEARAEQLLAQCPETLRLRQVWTIASEAYLEAGRLAEAEQLVTKLFQMSRDVEDVRSEGWAAYLQGHLLLRRGEVAAAVKRLEQAVELSNRGGDLSYRLAAVGRLMSAQLQVGRVDDAVQLGVESSRTLARAHLRNPTIVVDGVLLAAAALQRAQAGTTPDAVRRAVRDVLRWRWQFASALRYTSPWYAVGKGAWLRASGKRGQGDKLIRRGLEIADELHLVGERQEIDAYLARLDAAARQVA